MSISLTMTEDLKRARCQKNLPGKTVLTSTVFHNGQTALLTVTWEETSHGLVRTQTLSTSNRS